MRLKTGTGTRVERGGSKPAGLWSDGYILSLLLAVGISFLGFGLVSPLRTLYARAEGASGGEVGLMAGAYLFSAFIFLFPFGWLADRWNRVALIAAGLLAHGMVTLLFMWATSGEAFIALRFLEGITTAAVMPAARALLADLVPPGRNGEAFGLMSAGMTFGMLGGPPAGTFLASAFGYTLAYVISALIFIPATLLVLAAFRHYRPEKPAIAAGHKPEKAGPVPPGLWSGPIISGVLFRVGVSLGPGLAISVWSIYMADLGFELNMIGWTYSVYAIPVLLVAPGAGRLSDRYGRLLMMFGGGLLLSLVWVIYGLVNAFILFMVLGVVEGSLDAVARSANDGYLADHSPPESRGRAQAIFNAANQFGNLAGALLAGYLYEIDKTLSFKALGGLQLGVIVAAMLLNLAFRGSTVFTTEAQSRGEN